MKAAPTADDLHRFLGLLDGENWEELAAMLTDDVELADELTATWLRGRDAVSAYLRASTGVVTEIVSTPSDLASRRLGDGTDLHTFHLRQRYLLDGQERRERLTGCAVFTHVDGRPRLALFQLGQSGVRTVSDGASERTRTGAETSVGSRVRRAREAAGFSLRALAERTGLSASSLSQVERSQADVSVAALTRIARAVGAGVGDLIGEDGAGAVGVGRSTFGLPEFGMSIEVCHAPVGARLEAGMVELHPDAPAYEPRDTSGERVVYVVDGALAILGVRPAVLHRGEAAHLRGGGYGLAAHGRRTVRFMSTHLPTEAAP
ncbi:MAG: hypothetical protein AVDCRST_MAG79-947 [uncultured Thermoleophilia bacterium]|uniref:HTH cro/C1-type domain-containing protein n=1 Tax=uncultured Thermoleophilia bacterium TaxID=1497501 RepID=A0A6J4TSD4_9ACTN|nr:MAG: hypothetical protein AVDCRST_MAG79-947 [uncultured Thermoleophilia bacterium]